MFHKYLKKLSQAMLFCTVLCGLASCSLAEPTRGTANSTGTIRLACVGDSITVGAGVSDRAAKSYPVLLGQWLGQKWDVRNFGGSGSTLLKKGNLPYWERPYFRKALAFKPDVTIIMLGTNDSKHGAEGNPKIADNWQHKADFADDYISLVAQFRKVNPSTRIFLCLPPPAFAPNRYGIDGPIIKGEIVPLIREVAVQTKAELIDLHTPFEGKPQLFHDRVHPNDAGTRLIAAAVYRVLTGRDAPPGPDTETGATATAAASTPQPAVPAAPAPAGVPTPAREEFHIYLLMGQSNMAGRDTRSLDSQTENPRVLALNAEGQWVVARDPLHPRQGRTLPGVGPGIPFALEMLKADPGVTIGLVPCAVGGTSMRTWGKGAPHYEKAVSQARLAAQAGTIKGVLWHQGESDTGNKSNADAYEARLTKMLGNLRADLNLPVLPTVVGQLGDFLALTPEKYPYAETVRVAIKHVPAVLPGVGYADSAGLGDKGDKLHFSVDAEKEMGSRYAKAMLELQK